jgi:hypothetical protein
MQYKHIIEGWLSKVPVVNGLRFELSAFVSEFWPHDLGKDGKPQDLFTDRELQILAWVVAINQSIQERLESIALGYRKDFMHRREEEWLISGDPKSMCVMLPEISTRSVSRLKTICRELSEDISTPLVNGIFHAVYGRALEILQPRIEELKQCEEEQASRLDMQFTPSAILVRLSDIRLALQHSRERIETGAVSQHGWQGAINSKLGRLITVEGAGNSWSPQSVEELERLIQERKAPNKGVEV